MIFFEYGYCNFAPKSLYHDLETSLPDLFEQKARRCDPYETRSKTHHTGHFHHFVSWFIILFNTETHNIFKRIFAR